MKKFILTILLLLLLAIPSTSYASLTFGAATTDIVNFGTSATLDAQETFTYMSWVYPTTLTASRRIWQKLSSTAGVGYRYLIISGTSGFLEIAVDCATTDAWYVTNNLALTINKWWFVAVTWNSAGAAGQKINIYVGDLSTLVSEATYSLAQDNVGATVSPSGGGFGVGNRPLPAGVNVPFQGRIAFSGFWDRELSLGEIKAQQFFPHKTPGNVLYSWLGFNGTGTQPDWSGNNNSGTVTGATVSANVPLGPLRR